MMELVTQITNAGHLPRAERLRFDDTIRGLAGKRVRINVKLYQKKRSTSQNNFYWSQIVPRVTAMFREYGNYVDDEDTHEFLKMRVGKLAQVIVLPSNEVVKGLGSTTKLSTMEFEAYLERIRAWVAPWGLVLPFPGEDIPDNADRETSETIKE